MKRASKVLALGCLLALVFFLVAGALAADVEPKVGQTVNAKFPKPMSDEDAKYLGLDKAAEFTVKDVKAPYFLVEQFSTTCPHCMAQAPVLNTLYSRVQQDAQLKDKVKFAALGQGDAEDKAKMWKAFQKVPFPVIPDPNSTLGDALNFHPYPVTLVLDKNNKIVFVHIGAFENTDEIMKELKAALK
jgi:thiol-disulfide isomerase/thioredoxin